MNRSPCRGDRQSPSGGLAGARPPLSRVQALEPARHAIEGLGHLVAGLAQRLPQVGQVHGGGAAHPLWAGTPARGAASASTLRPRLTRRLPATPLPAVPPGRSPAFQALVRAARCGAPASPRIGPTRLSDSGQLEFQPGDLSLGSQRILRHCSDDTFQHSGGVGQIVGRDRHTGSGSEPQPLGTAKPSVKSICRTLPRPELSPPVRAATSAAASATRSLDQH
jgi:hypothetical protein